MSKSKQMEEAIANANSIADSNLSSQLAKHGKGRGKFQVP